MLSFPPPCYQHISISSFPLQVRKTEAYSNNMNFPDTNFPLGRGRDRDPTAVPAAIMTLSFFLLLQFKILMLRMVQGN